MDASPEEIAAVRPDAVLACGPLAVEVELLRALRQLSPTLVLGGVSPGLAAFPEVLGADPEGFLAPVHWHADLRHQPSLGPPVGEPDRPAVLCKSH